MTSTYQINKPSREASGNYWITTTTGVHQVYCDMELMCGGHKGGWMRIADLATSSDLQDRLILLLMKQSSPPLMCVDLQVMTLFTVNRGNGEQEVIREV